LIGAGIAYSLVGPGSARTTTTTVDQTTTQTVTVASTSTTTATQRCTSDDCQVVTAQVALYGGNLSNRDFQGIASFYTNSSDITNYGKANVFNFQYPFNYQRTDQNVSSFYEYIAGQSNYTVATLSNLTMVDLAPQVVNASFDLVLAGSEWGYVGMPYAGIFYGAFNMTIFVQQQWVNQGGGNWKIQNETWDWVNYWLQHSD
jgi:hypothetical protein